MTVSLSGLDLSFLKKSDPNGSKPGRYRLDRATGEMVPVREWYRRNPQIDRRSRKVAAPHFMPDVDAHYGGSWKSIVDGSEISSRSNWREHNRRNDVVDVGDRFWSKDGDDARYTREKMGYDPSLVGSDEFQWK